MDAQFSLTRTWLLFVLPYVWLFRWRKMAFWAYCASVGVNFVLSLLFDDSFWLAAIDVAGLAGLLALMIRIEPGSWKLLD